jgi:hypothetical protein
MSCTVETELLFAIAIYTRRAFDDVLRIRMADT